MRKVALGLAALGLVTFGAFGQGPGAHLGAGVGRENLLLIWINALELSPTQMKAVLALVDELMPLREEIVAMPEKLHADLLTFTGTGKELRELLSSYQKELREKLRALEEKFVAGLKKILTVAQWEAQWERVKARLLPAEKPEVSLRGAPVGRPRAPARPLVRVDFLRGMTLVRVLPDLREVLAAKLEALGQ
jgi:hypothetical protein